LARLPTMPQCAPGRWTRPRRHAGCTALCRAAGTGISSALSVPAPVRCGAWLKRDLVSDVLVVGRRRLLGFRRRRHLLLQRQLAGWLANANASDRLARHFSRRRIELDFAAGPMLGVVAADVGDAIPVYPVQRQAF